MMDLDGGGDPLLSSTSKYLLAPGPLREAFPKLAAAFFSWFPAPVPNPNPKPISIRHGNFHFPAPLCFRFPHHSFAALFGPNFSSVSLNFLFQPFPVLSLAAALIPPFDPLTPAMLAIPPQAQQDCYVQTKTSPCYLHCVACVEPLTGIHFPSLLAKENHSNLLSEVLVGTGSRVMTIIRIKTLKVYAFGFYIHRDSVCQKLGSKYGSVPAVELKERHDFYEDLLREDIGMTVRLVVNYNGLKINKVKDAFEKSLRARLAKTNPETDFKCISTFGSYFTKDIPLPVGTVIDFRRTADGKLITEIGGNEIGAVHSKELCRAFFDMYIGEVPVSEQTKEEIGKNVASIIGRC